MDFKTAMVGTREAVGVTLADAARKAGLPYVTVYRWEHGMRIPRRFSSVVAYLDAIGARKRDVAAVERAYHATHREPVVPPGEAA